MSLLTALADAIAKRVAESREQAAAAAESAQQRAREEIAARAKAGDPQAIALMARIRAFDRANAAPAPSSTTPRAVPPAPSPPLPSLPAVDPIVPAIAPSVAAVPRAAAPSPVAARTLGDAFRGSNLVRAFVVAEAIAPPVALRYNER